MTHQPAFIRCVQAQGSSHEGFDIRRWVGVV